MKKTISKRKTELLESKVNNCEGDQKKLFSLIQSLFGSKKISVARIYQLFYFGIFNKHVFIEKNHMIKMEFPLLEACLVAYSFVDKDIIMHVCTAVFDTFQPLSCNVLSSIINNSLSGPCELLFLLCFIASWT